jgi:hypothetical protein
VQCLAAKAFLGLAHAELHSSGLAIDRIADQRVAEMAHMDTHLMGAAGFQAAFHEGGAFQCFHSAIMCHGVLAAPLALHGHLLAIPIGPPDPCIDRAACRAGMAAHDREVAADDAVILELAGEPLMGGIGFRHHQQPRGVFVDAVYDAGTCDAPDAGQLPRAVVQQRIDQGSVEIACCRVHHKARWLVDHDQVRVLVNDSKRNILRRSLGVHRLGQGNGEGLTGCDLGRWIPHRHAAFAGDMTFEYQRLKPLARERRHQARQSLVQTRAGMRLVNYRSHAGTRIPHRVGMWGWRFIYQEWNGKRSARGQWRGRGERYVVCCWGRGDASLRHGKRPTWRTNPPPGSR